MRRDLATSALELAGMGAISAGSALIYLPAGLIVGGFLAVVVGYLWGRM